MARTNDSAMQRLQVGLVGLFAVLLFVSIASMILNRAGNSNKAPVAGDATKTANGDGDKTAIEEPLVELGVTPVVQEQPKAENAAPAAPR